MSPAQLGHIRRVNAPRFMPSKSFFRLHSDFRNSRESRRRPELALDRCDFSKRRQARLIAEMLDFVGGGGSREVEMLLPTHRRIGEVGMNVGAVEDVSRSTGIENSIRRHGKSGKRPNGARIRRTRCKPRSPSVTPPIRQPRLLR